MECPVCYTSKAKYKLICDHSFCYQCISHWYQEYNNNTCPICRQDICFVPHDDTRELHVQCTSNATIDDYIVFQDLLRKYEGLKIKDLEYLRRQDWVEWVMEHRAKNHIYTKYTFYGLQGAQETCYKKRQKESKTSVLTKVC